MWLTTTSRFPYLFSSPINSRPSIGRLILRAAIHFTKRRNNIMMQTTNDIPASNNNFLSRSARWFLIKEHRCFHTMEFPFSTVSWWSRKRQAHGECSENNRDRNMRPTLHFRASTCFCLPTGNPITARKFLGSCRTAIPFVSCRSFRWTPLPPRYPLSSCFNSKPNDSPDARPCAGRGQAP